MRKKRAKRLPFFRLTQRSRAHEAPGTPAKVYKRRVTNQGLRTILESRPTWPDKSQANVCDANAAVAEGLANRPLSWGIVPSETKVYCPIADPQIVHTGPDIPDCSCRGI